MKKYLVVLGILGLVLNGIACKGKQEEAIIEEPAVTTETVAPATTSEVVAPVITPEVVAPVTETKGKK
ncbi:MAG: hypothetical protein ABIB46_04590 [bacterium]